MPGGGPDHRRDRCHEVWVDVEAGQFNFGEFGAAGFVVGRGWVIDRVVEERCHQRDRGQRSERSEGRDHRFDVASNVIVPLWLAVARIEVVAELMPVTGGLADVATECAPRVDEVCLLYTSPSPRDRQKSRMPSSA